MLNKAAQNPNPIALPNHVKQILLGVFDIDGVFRGKRMSRQKFLKSYENGFGFHRAA